MIDPEHKEALVIARQVACEASQLLLGAAGAVGAIGTKSNSRDLVTEWDTRCDQLILERLGELSPGVAVLAEESGAHGEVTGQRVWVVDPIDGTVNFAHGVPFFAVSIALEIDGVPVAGVVEAPALQWNFSACKGGGATWNERPISVSKTAAIAQSMLSTGFPYDSAVTSHNFAQWEHFQRRAGACRRFGAASLDLCMVARGWFDGYWETKLSPWDLAAGALIVQEAGGHVTGITGESFSSRKGHVIASNGAIHSEILAELAVVGTPSI